MKILLRLALAASIATLFAQAAFAQEAVIRKNISERLPDFPKIDEVTKTPIPGVYELRVGTELVYSDERGEHIIQGAMIDTKTGVNLTEARIDKLTAIDFASLPLKDAIVYKQGTGARKLVVFADPNCGYCKKFERELLQVKDVTVYTFLYSILGGDSPEVAQHLVRERQHHRLARVDGEWRRATACDGPMRCSRLAAQPGNGQEVPRQRHAGAGVRRRQACARGLAAGTDRSSAHGKSRQVVKRQPLQAYFSSPVLPRNTR